VIRLANLFLMRAQLASADRLGVRRTYRVSLTVKKVTWDLDPYMELNLQLNEGLGVREATYLYPGWKNG
jgi:hypothetical protein